MDIINSIISLGASVMMPVIFFIIALCFGVKIGTAFKAGMLVGIGFEGVGLVIGLLLTNLGPASQAMVERIGLQLTVVDTGWPTASTIGWGSPLMLPVVVGFIVINLAMLLLKLTKTVNIDIFNYWIFLIMGSVVYAGTGNYWLSVGITFAIFVLTLLAADLTAPYLQKNYNLKGISFPHLTCIAYVPFGIALITSLKRPRLSIKSISIRKVLIKNSAFLASLLLWGSYWDCCWPSWRDMTFPRPFHWPLRFQPPCCCCLK
ncbi:PTS system protein [Klebsiella pneumoniae]|nr:PTS system protein [Klebsiella pneumoniae]